MNQLLRCLPVAFAGVFLAGCPIYPEQTRCMDDYDCQNGYACRGDVCVWMEPGTGGFSGSSARATCSAPSHCSVNEVCGADGYCHTGDCFFSGCVVGYECILDGYSYRCAPKTPATVDSGASTDTGSDVGIDAISSGPWCGNPRDCAEHQVCNAQGQCAVGTCLEHGCVAGYHCETPDGGLATCAPDHPASCIGDNDCDALGIHYVCVFTNGGGRCTAPGDLCSDKSQCPVPSESKCVDGKCLPSCTTNENCHAGYQCDIAIGGCSTAVKPCFITADCAHPALVCVDGACVDRCKSDGTCADTELACVANGCVPNQARLAVCQTQGTQDTCTDGSICLHGSCYVSCTTDPDTCRFNPPETNLCKSLTFATDNFNICGSESSLGSDCDPTVGEACSDEKHCVDGYCR